MKSIINATTYQIKTLVKTIKENQIIFLICSLRRKLTN